MAKHGFSQSDFVGIEMNVFRDTCILADPTDGTEIELNIRQAAFLRDKLNEWLPYYNDEQNFGYAQDFKKKQEEKDEPEDSKED